MDLLLLFLRHAVDDGNRLAGPRQVTNLATRRVTAWRRSCLAEGSTEGLIDTLDEGNGLGDDLVAVEDQLLHRGVDDCLAVLVEGDGAERALQRHARQRVVQRLVVVGQISVDLVERLNQGRAGEVVAVGEPERQCRRGRAGLVARESTRKGVPRCVGAGRIGRDLRCLDVTGEGGEATDVGTGDARPRSPRPGQG